MTDPSDPWECIRVFHRLDVGPVRVEPLRVVAPYTLTTDAGVSSAKLIYRYEHNVFDPSDQVDRNLASMIVSQLALNYGLFAREICFDGLYDETDRQFLREMAENTAREITVKKLLEENPFLRGPAAQLPTVNRDRYSWATLSFTDSAGGAPATRTVESKQWSDDPSRHAILSSGGKESLLTLGILNELGRQTYPIFINVHRRSPGESHRPLPWPGRQPPGMQDQPSGLALTFGRSRPPGLAPVFLPVHP